MSHSPTIGIWIPQRALPIFGQSVVHLRSLQKCILVDYLNVHKSGDPPYQNVRRYYKEINDIQRLGLLLPCLDTKTHTPEQAFGTFRILSDMFGKCFSAAIV